ncbi:hypothetical protein HR45_11960 [Shewanella mangrovi]|uniref:Uncharacterized protein n=1 Tax=Shewanella mangrovi TaxID=1515746 RepID=A0A094JXF2_9GAMM|nr:hypothetical protein [Shewanella mangrovi]KFZ37121.1 hypothetical protein HR45_11960 [Shewanella mangrovi]
MQQIRQRLSAIEKDIRSELVALDPQWRDMALGDIIELMAKRELCGNAIYARLVRLDAAICQLELGLYGLCADCEAEIEADRIASDPTEQRCQLCDEQFRHQHRQELRLTH